MSECGKKTSGPLGLGVSTCVRASWHDGECRPWLTSDERDEAELATLRADLARVTAELAEANGALQALEVRMFDTVTTVESERDAARTQVRELASKHGGPPEALDAIRGLVAKLDAGGEAAVRAIVATRDARIAELEAALAGLVDALPRCDTCTKRGTTDWSGYGQAAIYCDEHLGYKSGSTLEWDSEAEAAERALGRRK